MKRLLICAMAGLLLTGCGLRTRRIVFYWDAETYQDIDMLVDVVYLYSYNYYPYDKRAQGEVWKLMETGPTAWFGPPSHDLYDKVVKDTFDIKPSRYQPVYHNQYVHEVDYVKRNGAEGLAVIVEYGERQPHPRSRAVVFLHKDDVELESKPKKVERVYIGKGYLLRLRKKFWTGELDVVQPGRRAIAGSIWERQPPEAPEFKMPKMPTVPQF